MTFLNACRNGQKSIVQIFLKKGGIDVNKRDAVNPEKPDVPLNKNDAFQKVQKRRVQEKR